MSFCKTLNTLILSLLLLASPLPLLAGDFDWLKELNLSAINDPNGFKARLGARFQVGDAQVSTVISNVTQPADAYMVMRLGELSGRPTEEVIRTYQSDKSKGWGALAKSLGIKPGSKEFHALKQGGDLAAPSTSQPQSTTSKPGGKREKAKGSKGKNDKPGQKKD